MPLLNHSPEREVLLFPFFRCGTRLREVKQLTQGHTARRGQPGVNAGLLSSQEGALAAASHPIIRESRKEVGKQHLISVSSVRHSNQGKLLVLRISQAGAKRDVPLAAFVLTRGGGGRLWK